MNINRENYEAFFLDFHEGQLSPDRMEEVLAFVESNPDLKSVFEDFELVTIPADVEIVFGKKSELKKNGADPILEINELNYEEFLIAEVEGLLKSPQLAALDNFINSHPHLGKDRKLYSLTKLPADNSIVFDGKNTLYKKVIPAGVIDASNFEDFLARELEGDLNAKEKSQLTEFLSLNPELENDRKFYALSRLTPGQEFFANKESLKHKVVPFRKIVYYSLSAAASITLLFSAYFLFERNQGPTDLAYRSAPSTKIEKPINKQNNSLPSGQTSSDQLSSVSIPTASRNPSRNQKHSPSNLLSNPMQSKIALAYQRQGNMEPLASLSAKEVVSRNYVDPQFMFIRGSQMEINQRMEFYYNLKLSDELEFARLNATDKDPGKTIFRALVDRASELLAFNKKPVSKEEKHDVNGWTFAELGVKTFNTITSSNVELNLQKDEEGKVVSYGIESSLVNFERAVK